MFSLNLCKHYRHTVNIQEQEKEKRMCVSEVDNINTLIVITIICLKVKNTAKREREWEEGKEGGREEGREGRRKGKLQRQNITLCLIFIE